MSNIVAFSQAGLPAVSSLSTALRSLEHDVGPAGVVMLKMDKTGHWVFGADQTEIEDESSCRIGATACGSNRRRRHWSSCQRQRTGVHIEYPEVISFVGDDRVLTGR